MRLQLNQAALAALLASASLVESRYRYAGCFSGLEIQHHGNYMFQSRGYCERRCSPRPVFGLSNGTSCFCGEVTPPFEQRVEEGHCNVPCAGYPINTCRFRFVSLVLLRGVRGLFFLFSLCLLACLLVLESERRGGGRYICRDM